MLFALLNLFLIGCFAQFKLEPLNIREIYDKDSGLKIIYEFNGTISKAELRAMKDDMLSAHNCVRYYHQVGALQIDSTVANTAQNWANQMQSSGSFQHSNSNYGENLYMQSGAVLTNGFAPCKAWYNEVSGYNYQNGGGSGTGHFTQMVWKNSIRTGFGIASGSSSTYVCANYDPPGNYVGQYTNNVFSPTTNDVSSCWTSSGAPQSSTQSPSSTTGSSQSSSTTTTTTTTSPTTTGSSGGSTTTCPPCYIDCNDCYYYCRNEGFNSNTTSMH